MSMLITVVSGFDFQRGIFCYVSIVTIALKCTVVELEAWDRWSERQTAVMFNAIGMGGGGKVTLEKKAC